MADFVAVLKKTLDGLSEATPQMREKVYEKARLTIAGKLAAMSPQPPAIVVERQKRALEDAIAEIEKEFATPATVVAPAASQPAAMDPLTELENVFASLKNPVPLPTFKEPARPEPVKAASPAPVVPPPYAGPAPRSVETQRVVEPTRPAMPVAAPFLDPEEELNFDVDPDEEETIAADTRPVCEPRSYRGLVATLAIVVIASAAGYGIWLNRNAFSDMFAGGPETAEVPAVVPPEATPEPAPEVASVAPAEDAGKPAEAAAPAPEAPPVGEGESKFTQRLNADGSEIDAGPAGGEPAIGEGTSVASVTQSESTEPPASAVPTDPIAAAAETAPPIAETPATPADAGVPATTVTTVPVGQRAIFYEERTNVAEASAEPGSIVWSLVQESPGGDLPPEPAIRAEATIPEKDVQLRMTIRRNADKTLPASHIVEVIFLTPEGFEGGGIDNVLRVSMKGSEQEAGSPLLGIPAKIADGFFLIALNDSKPEIDANMTLLRRQSWIDVPVQYKSGRRALFTMEKGIPGAKVFDEAMKAWQAATVAANAPG